MRIPAQGNDHSPPAFDSHWIVKRGTDFYDPSYGSGSYPNQKLHEQAAFWGYYAELNDLDASVTTPPGLVNEYYAMENEVDEANCTHILN